MSIKFTAKDFFIINSLVSYPDVKIATNSKKLGTGVLTKVDFEKERRIRKKKEKQKKKEEEKRKKKKEEEKKRKEEMKRKQKERLKEKRKQKEKRKEKKRKGLRLNKQFNTQQASQQQNKKQKSKQQQQQQQQPTAQPTWPLYYQRVKNKENRTQSSRGGYDVQLLPSENTVPYFDEDDAYNDASRQKRVQIMSPYLDNVDEYHELKQEYEDDSKIVVSVHVLIHFND